MLTLSEEDGNALECASRILMDGGVAIIPTETVYGIMTRWDNANGRQKIYDLKHRPANKLLQMLACDLDSAISQGVKDSPELRKLAEKFWPGALTAVVPAAWGPYPTIGLRIPNHPFLLKLLKRCGCAFAATSANLSGEKAAINALEATAHLAGSPDLCIDGGVITLTDGQASTVVSLLTADKPVILRQGNITLEEIRHALN